MLYALYHIEPETVGLIGRVLTQRGIPYSERHLYKGEYLPDFEKDSIDGLIVMGGPMSVNDQDTVPFLSAEIKLIQKALKRNRPILGICLGAQLIAKALGGRVFPNQHKEVGWYPIELTEEGKADELFKDLPSPLTVLHWHGETFELPPGAVLLATSSRCKNQAFRMGQYVYGFQFHFEVTAEMAATWANSPQGQADIHSANENAQKILNDSPSAAATLEPVAMTVFSRYMDLVLPKVQS